MDRLQTRIVAVRRRLHGESVMSICPGVSDVKHRALCPKNFTNEPTAFAHGTLPMAGDLR